MIRHPVKALEGATAARRGEQDKAKEAWKQGEHVEAAGHALAGAIPFIGPAAARAGEDIGEGRYRAGAADVAELALPYAKYAKDIPIPSTVSRAAKVATRPGVLLKGGETAASGAYATHSMWGAMWLTKNLGGLAKMVREEWSKTGAPETDTAMREDLAHSLSGKKFDNLTPGEQSSIRVLIDRIKNPSKTEEAGPKGLAEHQKQPGWWRNPADRPKPSVRESMGLKPLQEDRAAPTEGKAETASSGIEGRMAEHKAYWDKVWEIADRKLADHLRTKGVTRPDQVDSLTDEQINEYRKAVGQRKIGSSGGSRNTQTVRDGLKSALKKGGGEPDSAAADLMLQAVRRLEPIKGVPVSTLRLREALPQLSKAEFDRAAVLLRKQRRAFLSQHADPNNISDADRDLLIEDEYERSAHEMSDEHYKPTPGKKSYYVGVSERPH
jgi:hypothetical protein